jgi:transcriptional regulator with XRE-family HTH domain
MYENLKKIRLEQGMNQKEFGSLFGVKLATYAGYEIGTSDPKTQFWINVADHFKVSTDFLLGMTDDKRGTKYGARSELDEKYAALDDHGRRVVDLVMDAEAERMAKPKETVVIDLGTIRHYLYRPAAGPDGMVSGSDYEDIPRTADMPKNASYCLTVSGDSMEPYIKDGQMVYVEEDVPLGDMEVGVFFYQGGIYVKQYAPSFDSGIFLLSANPAREAANITVPRESVQDLYYMGKVILKKKLPPPIYR